MLEIKFSLAKCLTAKENMIERMIYEICFPYCLRHQLFIIKRCSLKHSKLCGDYSYHYLKLEWNAKRSAALLLGDMPCF